MKGVVDAGGLTALAKNSTKRAALGAAVHPPLVIPTVVLAEALTGDHRRDFHENRLIRACDLIPATEALARTAAQLRTATSRATSAADALVVATAAEMGGAVVFTSDPDDIGALAEHAAGRILVEIV